jgi:hypothetical protein
MEGKQDRAHHSQDFHMPLPATAFAGDPWPACQLDEFDLICHQPTAASSPVILKNGASNTDTSSSKK